ncbi:MAG TPA: F0F1 ATP synthase subunit B [Armatimonadetes bacterium]|nr:F0F1 ATP synthase subunit B [Armatimonadota bacterium]
MMLRRLYGYVKYREVHIVESLNPLQVLGELHLNWGYILTQTGSFLILLFLMSRFLFQPIRKLLEERQERVRRAVEDAEHEREEMLRLRHEYEERIAHIEEEARRRIQEAMQQAYNARDELLAQARAEAGRLLQRAREELEHEREKMLIEMRDLVADLAVAISEKIIERSLDARAHHELIYSIIERELTNDHASDTSKRSGETL